ncbi:MAG: hypothetical protein A2Y62_10315 [Candidatus Fischerbacteria bacterium RBG_13_37_8]|uniref:Uncharacterized protein n=1 Tax=Candidatus Fischerbacteria bacterium RBG_13_37_8 TaxID=1817863 RepID=A0A1F5VNE2_9BACT|nr:MAG: hypothetical protein A2Y62_10315 [Candidatus Fischerbacteria bacterium RBG_13_37_8]HJX50940.1 hypothetical protein [Candidatus Nanoarchaeia archaeon]
MNKNEEFQQISIEDEWIYGNRGSKYIFAPISVKSRIHMEENLKDRSSSNRCRHKTSSGRIEEAPEAFIFYGIFGINITNAKHFTFL